MKSVLTCEHESQSCLERARGKMYRRCPEVIRKYSAKGYSSPLHFHLKIDSLYMLKWPYGNVNWNTVNKGRAETKKRKIGQ